MKLKEGEVICSRCKGEDISKMTTIIYKLVKSVKVMEN